jgi:hypothetical protein
MLRSGESGWAWIPGAQRQDWTMTDIVQRWIDRYLVVWRTNEPDDTPAGRRSGQLDGWTMPLNRDEPPTGG